MALRQRNSSSLGRRVFGIMVVPRLWRADNRGIPFHASTDASFACIREIGVETGGSNIQFAVHPDTGRMIVIEILGRVVTSRPGTGSSFKVDTS